MPRIGFRNRRAAAIPLFLHRLPLSLPMIAVAGGLLGENEFGQ